MSESTREKYLRLYGRDYRTSNGPTKGYTNFLEEEIATLQVQIEAMREALELACDWLDSLNAQDEEGRSVGKGIRESTALLASPEDKGEKKGAKG
jgi:hypothetical protein